MIWDVLKTRKYGHGIERFLEDNKDAIARGTRDLFGKDIGIFDPMFDFIVDEEGVDTLVKMGGNPSRVRVEFLRTRESGSRGAFTIYDVVRIVTRCLYHGAKIDEEELGVGDLQFHRESVMSCRLTKSVYMISKRSAKYLHAEKRKFQFWARYRPEFYTLESGTFEDSEGYYQVDGLRRSTKVFAADGREVDILYMTSHRSDSQWMEDERAFGKFDRTSRILVSCIRNANRPFPRQVKAFKRNADERKALKSFLFALELNLTKKVLEYV